MDLDRLISALQLPEAVGGSEGIEGLVCVGQAKEAFGGKVPGDSKAVAAGPPGPMALGR